MRASGSGARGTGPTWKVVWGMRPQVIDLRAKGSPDFSGCVGVGVSVILSSDMGVEWLAIWPVS